MTVAFLNIIIIIIDIICLSSSFFFFFFFFFQSETVLFVRSMFSKILQIKYI